MANSYYDSYLDAKVDSASPLELIHLAYECAIGVVVEAREHLENGRIAERSHAITRATKILIELKGSLDHKAARDMSLQLARLYAYMLERLRDANYRQIAAPLIEVEQLLRALGESWCKLAAAETQSSYIPAAARPAESAPWIQREESRSFYGAAYAR